MDCHFLASGELHPLIRLAVDAWTFRHCAGVVEGRSGCWAGGMCLRDNGDCDGEGEYQGWRRQVSAQ
jgi:hypothetical protein